jgi:hypothetical protein
VKKRKLGKKAWRDCRNEKASNPRPLFVSICRYVKMLLLDLIMVLVIEDHALAQHFHWIEIDQPDWLLARFAEMLCLMVGNFTVCQ